MNLKPIWRQVASHTVRHNPGFHKSRYVGGSYRLVHADCGHESVRKISAGLPKKNFVRCTQCESLRNGAQYSTQNDDGTWNRYGWDAVNDLPTVQRVK